VNLLKLHGVTKRYPGVTALDGVDLSLEAGSVHALIGENGNRKPRTCWLEDNGSTLSSAATMIVRLERWHRWTLPVSLVTQDSRGTR
jgi:ABC-type branched-subunit amino acid transport system ATPase component